MDGDAVDLTYFWLATKTIRRSGSEDEGTRDPIVLTINQDGDDSVEATFEVRSVRDHAPGQAAIHAVECALPIVHPYQVNESSVRVGVRGKDRWEPERLFLWGAGHPVASLEGPEAGAATAPPVIVPIAVRDRPPKLSVDPKEGSLTAPLHLVRTGWDEMPIRRLWLLLSTSDSRYAGTDSPVTLQISGQDGLAVSFDLPKRYQDYLKRSQSNWFEIVPPDAFNRASVRSISLSIGGPDQWIPSRIFVFGLESAPGVDPRGTGIVPLVALEPGEAGMKLSGDLRRGRQSVELPLADYRPSMHGPGVVLQAAAR